MLLPLGISQSRKPGRKPESLVMLVDASGWSAPDPLPCQLQSILLEPFSCHSILIYQSYHSFTVHVLKLALEDWHQTTKATKFQVKAEISFSILLLVGVPWSTWEHPVFEASAGPTHRKTSWEWNFSPSASISTT